MIYQVRHRTILRYAAPVRLARFNLRLQPAPWPGQWTSDYELLVDPAPTIVESRPGGWPVQVARLVIESPISEPVGITIWVAVTMSAGGRLRGSDRSTPSRPSK